MKDILEDVKWLLLLAAAVFVQAALFKAFESLPAGVPFLCAAVIFIAVAAAPYFWPRAALMLLWTLGMLGDFAVRSNPFSLLFAGVGVYHLYRLLKARIHKEPASE